MYAWRDGSAGATIFLFWHFEAHILRVATTLIVREQHRRTDVYEVLRSTQESRKQYQQQDGH